MLLGRTWGRRRRRQPPRVRLGEEPRRAQYERRKHKAAHPHPGAALFFPRPTKRPNPHALDAACFTAPGLVNGSGVGRLVFETESKNLRRLMTRPKHGLAPGRSPRYGRVCGAVRACFSRVVGRWCTCKGGLAMPRLARTTNSAIDFLGSRPTQPTRANACPPLPTTHSHPTLRTSPPTSCIFCGAPRLSQDPRPSTTTTLDL